MVGEFQVTVVRDQRRQLLAANRGLGRARL